MVRLIRMLATLVLVAMVVASHAGTAAQSCPAPPSRPLWTTIPSVAQPTDLVSLASYDPNVAPFNQQSVVDIIVDTTAPLCFRH
jgi:hypothetical protein